jgi:UDP-3-O-[3-hydroxymyristoyl] glucosamine N-acyltransferase
MKISVLDVVSLVDGKISGDKNAEILNVAKIEEAQKGDLTFLYNPSYQKFFNTTHASVILVKTGFEKTRNDITYIEVNEPNRAFTLVLNNFFNPVFLLEGVAKSAVIHPKAHVEAGSSLGENVIISSGCKVGKNVKIFHNVVILENVEIGDDAIIFPNVTIRENCKIGNKVIIHANSVIGSDGFGYLNENRKYIKIPQIGNVVIEDDVEIGSNVSIDRAALGSTKIERGVKIDNLVQIAHNVVIGENTVISGQSGISGSTKVGKNCILAGQVGLAGHLEIGDNVIIGAQSGVSKSLLKPGIYFGYPAKERKTALTIEAHIRNISDYAERIKNLEKELNNLKKRLSDQQKNND